MQSRRCTSLSINFSYFCHLPRITTTRSTISHLSLEMAQGRGSAVLTTAVMLFSIVALLHLHKEVAEAAATYSVGGAGGWTFNVVGWPRGKRFRAGDTLVFNYNRGIHNVVAVNRAGYDNCKTTPGAKVYQTGRDQIKLAKGQNFFICNFPGHCESGMKIAITAA